ncbi:MAG: DUF134 domain-containing protein [Anaerolineae bacterium]|nr:DUF134 domain-containing protein [Anaerolineae bacterium]
MSRPRKKRTVEYTPSDLTFKPVGKPLASLSQVWLSYEELESLRLSDLEGLSQAEAGEHMQISRSTFQRTLSSARYKVAKALIEETALVIGNPDELLQRWRCPNCGHKWAVLHGAGEASRGICPKCGQAVDEEI